MGWVGKRVERRRFHVTRRPPPATDSGKLDWKCSSYPSLGSRFPSSLPPFALYPTFHSLLPLPSLLPPSPVQRHIAGGGEPCASFVRPPRATILPPWNDPFWHTDPILTSVQSPSLPFRTMPVLYSCLFFLNKFFFCHEIDRDRSVHAQIPFPAEEMAFGSEINLWWSCACVNTYWYNCINRRVSFS